MTRVGQLPVPRGDRIWSPTSISELKKCALSAAFYFDATCQDLRKPSTSSALGNTVHEVSQAVFQGKLNGVPEADLDTELAKAWDKYSQLQYEKLHLAWRPNTPPAPKEWQGYAITRRRSMRSMKEEILAFRSRREGQRIPPLGGAKVEVEFRADDLGIVGRPDRVLRTLKGLKIVDLKSNYTTTEITESHRRQLFIYAYLVHLSVGEWPVEIAIAINGRGELVENLIPDDAIGEVTAIRRDIDAFNIAVGSGGDALLRLGNANLESCKYCDYRATCIAFWNSDDEQIHVGAVAGVVSAVSDAAIWVDPLPDAPNNAQPKIILGIEAEAPVVGEVIAVVNLSRTANETIFRSNWYSRWWRQGSHY